MDLGRAWESFGEDVGKFWGGFLSILGWIFRKSGEESGRELKDLGKAGAESLIGAPALARSASQFSVGPIVQNYSSDRPIFLCVGPPKVRQSR